MFELGAPWVVPLVGAAAIVAWAIGLRHGVSLSVLAPEVSPAGRASRWRPAVPGLLRAGSVACLAGVVAGPYRTVTVPGASGRGVAIVLAVDVSESMGDAGADGRTKLDVAVAQARRFVTHREGDAIGLVAFGGDAVVRVPPTVDHAPVLDALGRMRAGDLGDGTAIGTALGLAANRLRGVEARSRVLLLITDGRSNAGPIDPVTAARAAAALGQHVYVVEVDDEARASSLLDRVASDGGGRHFEASDAAGMAQAYREIDQLEPSTFAGTARTARVPGGLGLLWIALGLVVLERVARAYGGTGGLP